MPIVPKTVLITGCSAGGVGAAFAEVFMERGYHVFATARTPSKIPQSVRDAPNVTAIALDVTSAESIAAAAEQVSRQTDKLDVLINNAGLGSNLPALDTSIDEAKKLFDINFFGALATMQAFSPFLIKAKGCVVNNSSVGGVLPFPFSSIYNAAKAALIQGSETWRLELAPLGVRTITLMTGGIATNFFVNQETPTVPETSNYYAIKNIIEDKPEENTYGIAPKVFASKVLQQVENGTTGKYWVGGGVGAVRTLLWLLPQGMIDRAVERIKPFSKQLADAYKQKAM